MTKFRWCRSAIGFIIPLFLCLLLSLGDSASAAEWAANFGGLSGAGADIQATATDAAGNTYLAGQFTGTSMTLGSVTMTKIGIHDAFVAKLDPSGAVLWARNFGGSGTEAYGQGIAVDGLGNVYLGGHLYGADLTTPALTKIGNQDAFAIKLDSTGATTWAKNFGGSGASVYVHGIAIDGFGNVYLGGDFCNASLTTPALTKIGTNDAFALKLSSAGTTTWAKNFGGSAASTFDYGIAVDGSGNVYLGGYFRSADLTTPALTKIGNQDAFAFKLDSTGATTWARNFGGSGTTTSGWGIAVDDSGGIYLGGGFQNGNLTTPPLAKIGNQDAFAFKLDSTGATTWAKNFGGSGTSAFGRGIAVDRSGSVFVGGYFYDGNLTTPAITKIGSQDAFAFKLDSTGATTWAKNFGGSGAYTYGYAIALDNSGNVYLGGAFQNGNLTAPALASIGSMDTLALKLDSNGATTWAKNFFSKAPGAVNVFATATDAGGNTFLAGDFDTVTLTLGSTTLTRIGTYDAFVAKLDASGTVVWAKNFGGYKAIAFGQSIAVDGSGSVYLVGYFSNANLTTPALTRIGDQDGFAIKLDSTGATTWARNFGGTVASVWVQGVAVDGSGNAYLGGYFRANLTTPAMTRIGNVDAFAIKLDSAGATTWAKNFSGSGTSTFGRGIAVDGSGSVYFGGDFQNASLTTPALTKIGGQDAFAFKLDSTGATTWAKNFGGSGASAHGNGITVDGSGNVYLGGHYSFNLTTPALTKIGNQDAFAIKLDSTGATTWAKNFGGSGAYAYGHGITVDGSGNVYLGGYFYSANLTTPPLTQIGTTDAFALEVDSAGGTTWARNFGGSGAKANSNGITVDRFGKVHVVGCFSDANLTTPTLTKIGSGDAFLIVSLATSHPTATTGSASSIATTTAALGGTVNDNGASTTVSFQYGPDTNYGSTVSGGTVAAGAGAFPVSAVVSGLTCNTTYHFRVTASNSVSTTNGTDATFTTSACLTQSITFGTAPTIAVGGASPVSATGGGSGNPVVFTSLTPSVCSVNGTNGATITGVTAGTCTIAADQGGSASFAAALQVTQSFTIHPATATAVLTITVNKTGSASGSVNSNPGGITCTGSGAGCSATFPLGTVDLYASSSSTSIFYGWAGACSGAVSPCSLPLFVDAAVTAAFDPKPLVKVGGTSIYYASIAEAYVAIVSGNVSLQLQIHAFFEDLFFNRPVNIGFKGGYVSDFTSAADPTEIHGSVTIIDGVVEFENIVIM